MSTLMTAVPGPRSGSLSIPASKSVAHRLLIVSAFSAGECEILCRGISRDIRATADCLSAMGADITIREDSLQVSAITMPENGALVTLPCGESGSTLRFLLPVVGALGMNAAFAMEGRLPERPMDALTEELAAHGARTHRMGNYLHCEGRLSPGAYRIPGNISSQYVSGLLFALPLLEGDSTLEVTGKIESADYIAMTEAALRTAGVRFEKQGSTYRIYGNQVGELPGRLTVESDWSSAAFFLCLGALSPAGVTVRGLNLSSAQGDRAVLEILSRFGAVVEKTEEGVAVRAGTLRGMEIDAVGIPDLVPVLSVAAAAAQGDTRFIHADRLRLKESDRIQTTIAMLRSLGASAEETEDGLLVHGAGSGTPGTCLRGGRVDSFKDHRIAMSAAVAASVCASPVEITDPACTDKSFPNFRGAFEALPVGSF